MKSVKEFTNPKIYTGAYTNFVFLKIGFKHPNKIIIISINQQASQPNLLFFFIIRHAFFIHS